jgi:hypothetical protein
MLYSVHRADVPVSALMRAAIGSRLGPVQVGSMSLLAAALVTDCWAAVESQGCTSVERQPRAEAGYKQVVLVLRVLQQRALEFAVERGW